MIAQPMNKLVQGFELVKQYISPKIVQTLIDEITNSNELKSPHGIRNAEKKFECIAELAH